MAMQHSPLLMSRILDRGARLSPKDDIVTATAEGVRRQTIGQTRDRAHQLAHALTKAGIKVGDRVGTFMWNGSPVFVDRREVLTPATPAAVWAAVSALSTTEDQ